MNATLIAVGYESFVDCDMFRWSCGSTIVYSPFLCPVSSSATLASTSLAFMLVEVPAPPWYQSTWNWSWYLPFTHGLRGLLDRREGLLLHGADVGVGARRGQLHDGPGFDEARIVVDRDSRDLEVLERPRRLDAVVGVRRDRLLAEQVALHARGRAGRCAGAAAGRTARQGRRTALVVRAGECTPQPRRSRGPQSRESDKKNDIRVSRNRFIV